MAIEHELKKEDLERFSRELNAEKRQRANITLLIIIFILFAIIIFFATLPIDKENYEGTAISTSSSEDS